MIRVPSAPSTLRNRIAAVIAVTSIGVHAPLSAAPVSKFTGDGAAAAASGYDATGCVWFYVEVNRTSDKAATHTWLYYDVYDVCAWQRVASGWGHIPDIAFKVNSKNAVLNLTVATTATFQTEGITGAITLTFTPNGTFEQRSSGHTTLKLVDRMIKYHGWWSYAAAAFTGRIMNIDVAGPYGQLGETRQRELIIERSVK